MSTLSRVSRHSRFSLAVLACGLGLATGACQEPEPPPVQEDPCPTIALDSMQGDWIKVTGKRGDHLNRFRITGEPGAYRAFLIPGFFTKLQLEGQQRGADYVFDEQLSGKMQQEFQTGYRTRTRMYVEPYKRSCSLRVVIASVSMGDSGKEVEKPRTPGFEEFLPFPKDIEFTFVPPTGPVFLGSAARDRSVAQSQLAQFEGGPKPDHPLGEAIPVGVFSDTSQDGPDSCSYDMDLYFDDKPYKGHRDHPDESLGKAVAAGQVKSGYRHWYVPAWFAPYGGNHMFELYRYRTCSGERELIEINGLEAILN